MHKNFSALEEKISKTAKIPSSKLGSAEGGAAP